MSYLCWKEAKLRLSGSDKLGSAERPETKRCSSHSSTQWHFERVNIRWTRLTSVHQTVRLNSLVSMVKLDPGPSSSVLLASFTQHLTPRHQNQNSDPAAPHSEPSKEPTLILLHTVPAPAWIQFWVPERVQLRLVLETNWIKLWTQTSSHNNSTQTHKHKQAPSQNWMNHGGEGGVR